MEIFVLTPNCELTQWKQKSCSEVFNTQHYWYSIDDFGKGPLTLNKV